MDVPLTACGVLVLVLLLMFIKYFICMPSMYGYFQFQYLFFTS